MFKNKGKQLHSIEIQGNIYSATLSLEDWPHGISVLVTVHDTENTYFKAKILCSKNQSDSYLRISKLPEQEQLNEAWLQFKKQYPFEELNDTAVPVVEVLLPWK